jgi:DNA repair protein RadC
MRRRPARCHHPARRAEARRTPYVSRLVSATARDQVHGPGDIYRLSRDMVDLQQEQLRVVLLDAGNRVLGLHLVYQGTLDGIDVRLADLFREAIRVGATAVALVHNHPSGRADQPSASDLLLTADAVRAGQLLGIAVLDHVVVGREQPRFFSVMALAHTKPDHATTIPSPAST